MLSLNKRKSIQSDLSSLKVIPSVGCYKIKTTYIKWVVSHNIFIKVIARDTSLPSFTKFTRSISIKYNERNYYFKNHFAIKDFNANQLKINTCQINFQKLGKYQALTIAIDENKNETRQKLEVIVKEKQTVPMSYASGENKETGHQIRLLIVDMQKPGYSISSQYSGYRSYTYQK